MRILCSTTLAGERVRVPGMTIVTTGCVLLGALALVGCGGADHRQQELTGPTMGTRYSVKLVDVADGIDTAAMGRRVDEVLQGVDARMSTYRPDSELSLFNDSSTTDWFAISEQTRVVIAAAQRISTMTGGAFDVTVGPLVNLWGFGPDGTRSEPPTVAETQRVRELIGTEKLALRESPPAIRKRRGDVYVDLSAIAKGYAVDRIAALLDEANVVNYLVEVGGELRARGHNAHGEPWSIAVERPASNQRSVQKLIRLGDGAIATSGDYRNYFEHAGQRYSHSIDPRTGSPVTHELASVTVIGESAMLVDALATAFTVLGPDAGFELAARERIAALFISRDGQGFSERSTAAFDELLGTP